MNDVSDAPERGRVDRQAHPERPGVSNDQIIDIFEKSFAGLRSYLRPILGDTALEAILQNAIKDNEDKHPVLRNIELNHQGLASLKLREQAAQMDGGQLLSGIMDLMHSIITVLTVLTGDVLTRKVQKYVDDIHSHLREGDPCNPCD